ncbi:MAG: hypothetical protein ACTHW7_05905 [Actinomycetaceae bacterium]
MKRMLTAIAATLALISATPAAATVLDEESETVETVYVENGIGGLTFSVEYTYDEPRVLDDELIVELAGEAGDYTLLVAFDPEGEEIYRDNGSSASENGTVSPQGTIDVLVKCGRMYTETQTTSIFTFQRACNSTIAQWGFRLNRSFQPSVRGTVNESGLTYSINGRPTGTNGPHPNHTRDHQFHGSIPGLPAFSRIVINNTITGKMNDGGSFIARVSGTLLSNRDS